MQEQLISFETAKLAKEKGFNERLKLCYYNLEEGHRLNGKLTERNFHAPFGYTSNEEDSTRGVSAPTQSLLQKWLREVHKINVNPIPSPFEEDGDYHDCSIKSFKYNIDSENCWGNTYEEALELGLQEALKLIEN